MRGRRGRDGGVRVRLRRGRHWRRIGRDDAGAAVAAEAASGHETPAALDAELHALGTRRRPFGCSGAAKRINGSGDRRLAMRPPEEDAPFRPRLRRRVLLRRILRGEGASNARPGPAFGLPVYAALVGLLLCFYKLFQALDAAGPAGPAGDKVAASDPLRAAAPAILWLILAAGLAGFLALAMERPPERKVGLQPGALRDLAREGWAWLRTRARGPGRAPEAPPAVAPGKVEGAEAADARPAQG